MLLIKPFIPNKKTKFIAGLCFFFFFNFICLATFFSQNQLRITGRVYDSKTLSPIPFVNIDIEGTIIGVESDERGEFELIVTDNDKSLIASAKRYDSDTILLGDNKTELSIFLRPSIKVLDEVIIGGVSAKQYMKIVIKNMGDFQFDTTMFFLTYINNSTYGFDTKKKKLYTYDEEYAFVNTRVPNSGMHVRDNDTFNWKRNIIKSRLVLTKRKENADAKNHAFLDKKIDKMIRMGVKAILKHEDSLSKKEIKQTKKNFSLPIETNYDPNEIYREANIYNNYSYFPFLDINHFKKVTFWFEKNPYEKKSSVVVIGFKTKKIGHKFLSGTITINKKDYFPFKMEITSEPQIPFYAKPLIPLILGFNIKNIKAYKKIVYSKIGSFYFLKEYVFRPRLMIKKSFFFKKNISYTIRPLFYGKFFNYKPYKTMAIDSQMLFKPRNPIKENYKPYKTYNLENYSWEDFR